MLLIFNYIILFIFSEVYTLQLAVIFFKLFCRSKIVFKTAGVLLDEMRDRGLNALKYKVIILDEVHERSVESDLVLLCVKQLLLKKNDLRLTSFFLSFFSHIVISLFQLRLTWRSWHMWLCFHVFGYLLGK